MSDTKIKIEISLATWTEIKKIYESQRDVYEKMNLFSVDEFINYILENFATGSERFSQMSETLKPLIDSIDMDNLSYEDLFKNIIKSSPKKENQENNIQNEYITHKLAKPNELWFHVKDGSGSHVVLAKENDITEAEIRCAAMLAAYYSYASLSSSVAVDYSKVKFIKKIPGQKGCFVSYSRQNTIYIDPDKKYIETLRVIKWTLIKNFLIIMMK